jgi:hypothetical protein
MCLGYYKSDNIEFFKHLLKVLRDKAGYTLGPQHELPKNASAAQILKEWDLPVDKMLELSKQNKIKIEIGDEKMKK